MPKTQNDSTLVKAGKELDAKRGPWPSIEAALTGIEPYMREIGMTINVIENGTSVEYWWKAGTGDADLVLKNPGVTGDKHHVHTVTNLKYVGVSHGLGKRPSVMILDEEGKQVFADVQHVDNNTVTVNFKDYFTGLIVFN